MDLYLRTQWIRMRPALGYATAILLALLGLLVRLILAQRLSGYPFLTFFPAVMIATYLGGRGPGLACGLISALLATELMGTNAAGHLLWPDAPLAFLLFSFVTLIIVLPLDLANRSIEQLLRSEAERERLQEQLHRQVIERTEERDRLWTQSNDAFLVTDRDFVWLSASPAWTRLLGWPAEELLGRTSDWLVHPDDRQPALDERQRLRAGTPSPSFELRLRARDGDYKWLSCTAAVEEDRIYCVARDMTEERARAEQLRDTQEKLMQSQKLESIGQLTGGVAHDFNNLLTPIIGSLDLLQRNGVAEPRAQRLIEGALKSAERAKLLVERLLAFARRQPLRPGPVDIAALAGNMRELIASTLGPRIRLDVAVAGNLPPVLADANQLEMAILNLSVNARDAMPDGGRLTLSADLETIASGHRSGLAPGDYVRFAVADTGSGMDEEVLARAVEPFFSTKGVGHGTGLGLSSVHGLIGQLGGAMTIESRPGIGTCVELWLPRAAAGGGLAAAEPGRDTGAGGSGTVLLVDDEALVRASLAEMLNDLGYRVIEAASAADALARLEAGAKVDLMISDYLMPGMTGVELARIVGGQWPGITAMIVSGHSDVEAVAPDLPRLTKPFRQEDLAALLDAVRKDGSSLAAS